MPSSVYRRGRRYTLISIESGILLRVLADKLNMNMGDLVDVYIREMAVRELGDGQVHRILQHHAQLRETILNSTSDPSERPNGSVGEAKKREDILGS